MNNKSIKILILGGGYGGLKCAITLQKLLIKQDIANHNLQITLVSKHDYHYQTTLLHKVAIGTYSTTKARIFYRTILDSQKIMFIKDSVLHIDEKAKKVSCKYSCYEYDYLIIALGFSPNYYNIPGVEKYAHTISSLNSAAKICKDIEHKFKDFTISKDKMDLSFIVCGSGFTGVEFSAELAKQAQWLSKVCGIDFNMVRVYIIGSEILPMFDPSLSALTQAKLKALGITIIKGKVTQCLKNSVILDDARSINGNTIIWSAGVQGSEIISKSFGDIAKNNRILVDTHLNMIGQKDIFAIGDSAKCGDRDMFHAPTAQLSNQMGEYVAKRIYKIIKGKADNTTFKFTSKGTVCSIAHTDAVGVVMGIKVSGEIAAFFKNVIENKWMYSIGGLINVFKKGQFRFRSSN